MIQIKRAREADAEILAELGRRTFIQTFEPDNSKVDVALYVTETYGGEKQLREIQDPARRLAVAWVEGKPAGYLHLRDHKPDPSVTGARPIELLRIYVDSRWHGRGVGPALMEASLQIARDEGFQTIWLGVWTRNLRAQAFYRKYKFEIVGDHIFKMGSKEQIDFIMSRAL